MSCVFRKMVIWRYDKDSEFQGAYVVIGSLEDIDNYISDNWKDGGFHEVISNRDANYSDFMRLIEGDGLVLCERVNP